MSGAWELGPNLNVLVGVLHTDHTTIAWALGLKNLIVPGRISVISGQPFDHARNSICQQGLDMGATHIMMLDSDVIPPHDAILRLAAHDLPIVSGLYCRRSPPVGVPVMQKPPGQWITQYPQNAVFEVDVVGAGCLLIKTDVLRALPPQAPGKHWFRWGVDMRGTSGVADWECMSEDFTFNIWAKHHGFPTFVDSSVACKHLALAEATYARFDPLAVVPVG